MIPAPNSKLGSRAAAGRRTEPAEPSDTRPTSGATDRLATQALDVLAAAAEARFDDPRTELERTVLLAVMLDAGRELERTLNAWLCQTLAGYRGSRGAWDLRAASVELRLALARFQSTVEATAEQLYRLVPGQADKPATSEETAASAATAGRTIRERTRDGAREPVPYEVSA
jgi:hypothetical protein